MLLLSEWHTMKVGLRPWGGTQDPDPGLLVNRVTGLIVMHNLIFVSEFTKFRPTENFGRYPVTVSKITLHDRVLLTFWTEEYF